MTCSQRAGCGVAHQGRVHGNVTVFLRGHRLFVTTACNGAGNYPLSSLIARNLLPNGLGCATDRPRAGRLGNGLPPGRPMLFERTDEVFAGTWIGFSEDDARSIAEGANIRQQSCGLSPDALSSRRGDRCTQCAHHHASVFARCSICSRLGSEF
jgi:hypothetical protein